MHAGRGEAFERRVGLARVVHHPRHHDGDVQSSSRYVRCASPSSRTPWWASRSSIVQARQWLLAWPATTTASKPSSVSTSAWSVLADGSPSGPSVTSGPSIE